MKTKITRNELKEMLLGLKGADFVTILAATKVKVPKSAPFENLIKVSRVNGVINSHYERAVNRQREREGIEEIFQVHRRAWGNRIANSSVIDYKGTNYLELQIRNKCGYFYCDGDKILEKEVVEPFLPPLRDSARQGVDKEVILRDYRFDSLKSVIMHGTEFEIKD